MGQVEDRGTGRRAELEAVNDALARTGLGPVTAVAPGSSSDAYRMAFGEATDSPVEITAGARPTRLGVMLDLSRNSVLRVPTIETFLAHIALLGYTTLWLYLEDTYEVPDHPEIGHGRGRYSAEELRAIDDAAHRWGIEVVPIIQTLGHMRQVLKGPRLQHLRGFRTPDVLDLDQTESFALIESMVRAATWPFRSKRVHVGLDEAFGFAAGVVDRTARAEVFVQHALRVAGLCHQLGLEPIMWSDMLFDLPPGDRNSHNPARIIPPQHLESLRGRMSLAYWDYFHHDADHYVTKLGQHGDPPAILAAGCATWGRWWTQLRESIAVCTAAAEAAVAAGTEEAIITTWGDDGAECDIFSTLPALARFADTVRGIPAFHSRESLAAWGIDWDVWVGASDLDHPLRLSPPREETLEPPNPAKWLLWLDPLISFADIGLDDMVPRRMRRVMERSRNASGAGLAGRLDIVTALADVLELKAELHLRLRPAHLAGDRPAVEEVVALLEQLIPRTTWLAEVHRRRWLADRKPFGWEVMERRYAGLASRLNTTVNTLRSWLDGTVQVIETLEVEPIPIVGPQVSATVPWSTFATPSAII